MKSKLLLFALFFFSISIYGQVFINGTIVTQRYDTIANIKIKKLSDAKSIQEITYIDSRGNEQSPKINTIRCYTRGNEFFCRIFYSEEMVLVKRLVAGEKLNLYVKDSNGKKIYYIEKVYYELIKVPTSGGKFRKVLSNFLSDSPQISEKIKSKELQDIEKIVALYNKG